MMNFDMFIEEVVKAVGMNLEGLEVKQSEIVKNNGVKMQAITIVNKAVNISPVIYLEKYFEEYQGGKPMDDIVGEIIRIYKDSEVNKPWDVSVFTNYERAKNHLRPRLINTEKNKEFLEEVPHRDILDLSLIYTVEVKPDISGDIGTITVRNEHMKMWGVDEQTLYEEIMKNMDENEGGSIRTMKDIIGDMFDCAEDLPGLDAPFHLYVLTNKDKLFGASQLLNKKMLEQAAQVLGSDFIILPSSVHELLLYPVMDETSEMEHMASMVREVNDSSVAENEILSYHVYRYNHVSGEINIAA